MKRPILAMASLWLAAAAPAWAQQTAPQTQRLTVWAWERPEDLRFLGSEADIAVQTGFIQLSGRQLTARGRRFPLLARPEQVTTALVHVQIDRRTSLVWTPDLRRQTARAVLAYALARPVSLVQVDFEVRASERAILLDLLKDVRAGLPPATHLSMTALASWCDTDRWLAEAPVDEIAPMLFRMGHAGDSLRTRLAEGGDFGDSVCRTALAVSVDAPIPRAPTGRHIYIFSPRSWTPADYALVRERIVAWPAKDGPSPSPSSP
ncbi:MAG: hypothetical protein P4L64_06240 [Caulobacteraceae bacterium]|nr:hypothetical protein [Caulobacteraceae bacterium]